MLVAAYLYFLITKALCKHSSLTMASWLLLNNSFKHILQIQICIKYVINMYQFDRSAVYTDLIKYLSPFLNCRHEYEAE